MRRHLIGISKSSCFSHVRARSLKRTNLSASQNRFSSTSTNGCELLMSSKQPVVSNTRGVQKAWNFDASGQPLFDETPAPSSADVVVIGGGSLGCSALYHLAKLGVTNTVLVEANKLTAGTTWHSAGLVWDLQPTDMETEIMKRSLNVIKGLERETKVNSGWVKNGGLFLASSQVRFDMLKRMATFSRTKGVEAILLDNRDTKKLCPLMNVDDLHGALYCPGSGTVDPAGLCNALSQVSKKLGAQVLEDCHFMDLKTTNTMMGRKKVSEVKTSRGDIKTNCVINATGVWANSVTSKVGLSVPLVAKKHAYVVTEKIPGIQNMPNVRDYDYSTYFRLQGDALCIGGYETSPVPIEKIALNIPFGLYDLDYEVFGPLMKAHVKRIPALQEVGIKFTVCGPESFTPDFKPIMGEDPAVDGFFHCCGFNSTGLMKGVGCGEQIAKWVVHGRPELAMFNYDVRRFYTPLLKDKHWVKARTHEAYVKNYSSIFPHSEPLAGRSKRRSPLHGALERVGCVFQERHGWERPGWFNEEPTPIQTYDWYGAYGHAINKDQRYVQAQKQECTFHFPAHQHLINAECEACRTAVAGFDMSYFGKFYLTGPDAARAADHLFSANMRRPEGSTVYTCMLNKNSGIEADLTVSIALRGRGSACDPRFHGIGYYLSVGGEATLQTYSHIVKEIHRHKWNVSLVNNTEDLAVLSIQGPKSRSLLSKLTSTDLSNESFPFSTHQVITVAGHKVRAMRISSVGELGWELHIPRRSALAVHKALKEAGEDLGYRDCGHRALDSLSCEKGYRLWHSDIRSDDTPLEAGLGFTCKLKTDIPFLGRDALEKQKAGGITKKLVTLTLGDPKTPLWGNEAIKRDGEYVGFVRRAEYGVSLGTSIACGYVRKPDNSVVDKGFLASGKWSIEVMCEEIPAELHLQHPFDPQGERMQGNY
ncbi:FAD dependent oxidoreductase central domain [Trinorchestia longiramus]|nr:FAD dependent oxidoreductase central domain [Trinorchestia longiramus]